MFRRQENARIRDMARTLFRRRECDGADRNHHLSVQSMPHSEEQDGPRLHSIGPNGAGERIAADETDLPQRIAMR